MCSNSFTLTYMKKYTFFLGLNDKDTKTQLVDTWLAISEVSHFAMENLWGGSISLVSGLFQHDDGTQVKENTLKIESLGFRDESEFVKFAKRIKAFYNQESVLMEVSDVDAHFV